MTATVYGPVDVTDTAAVTTEVEKLTAGSAVTTVTYGNKVLIIENPSA